MEVCQQKMPIIQYLDLTAQLAVNKQRHYIEFRLYFTISPTHSIHIPKLDKINYPNLFSVLQYNLFFFTCLLVINATSDNIKYQLQDCLYRPCFYFLLIFIISSTNLIISAGFCEGRHLS
jgi:hypothetical protein